MTRIGGKVIFRTHLASFIILLLALSQPLPAFAVTKRAESNAARTRNHVDTLNKDLYGITKRYNSTLTKLERIQNSLQANQEKTKELNTQLAKDQEKLNSRIQRIYLNGTVSIFDVLLESKDFYQFTSRLTLLERIVQQDTQLLNSVKRQKAEIEKINERLLAERKQMKSAKKRLSADEARMKAKLQEQQKLLASAKNRSVASRPAPRITVSREGSSASLRGGFIFPVAGPHTYSNDWGEPRDGHRHQGNDIFALRGTPVVAVVSGSVGAHYSGNAGKMLYLYGSDGNTYEYMHLSGFAVSEGGVSAGQVIGYVGNTGNARGGSPHLHFEIHPGGDGPVNPYPTLRAAE